MEKQDLLLLHGALGSQSQFSELIPLLEDEFEVYTMDFSGHGDKPAQSGFGIITFANEVLDQLTRWDIDKINVFGYSMGGYVAAYLARNTNRINKAFTLGTKYLWTTEYAEKEVQKLNAEKIQAKVPAFAEELKRRHVHMEWTEMLAKTRDMMLELGRSNLLPLEALQEIQTQFCIAVGDSDVTVSAEETTQVYRAIRHSNLCILPDTQHPLEKVKPQLLAPAIIHYFHVKKYMHLLMP